MQQTLEDAIKGAGLETEIRNMVYHFVRNAVSENKTAKDPDPLAFLKRAGVQWDRRVRKSLNAMCNELKVQLIGQQRIHADREEMLQKWEELSNYALDLQSFRPVYAPKDLLEVLISLKGPTAKAAESTEFVEVPKWEFSHISLPVKNLFDLRELYGELLRIENFSVDISQICKQVLEMKYAPLCQSMLKKGNTPVPYRGALWSYVLGSASNQHLQQEHWENLKATVLKTDHIVDKLVFKDIQLTASNDDQYFVFEDVLYQVMLCFFRDADILNMIQFEQYPVKGKQYDGPPSGVVPFHGICMFAAPFCYIYNDPVLLYTTFREFYVRYCHRLTTINTHQQGIVSLCLLYEKLLQTYEPELWSHFRELQIQPIRVIFKWIMRAFSGHLPPDQLLILWDLILGYDSLEILPLFAILILSFRKENLMQVNSLDNIDAILADLSSIKVLPLLKMALGRDK